MTLHGQRVLLTGASSGIGACLAGQLADRGAHLILVGRDLTRLSSQVEQVRAQAGTVIPLAADLMDPDSPAHLAREVRKAVGGVDILINNAGVQRFQWFDQETPEAFERLFQLNMLAPMRLSHALLPDMLAQRQGHIVNVGSLFGTLAFPGFASYSASKFALRGWSEALRRELVGTGIAVTYMAPRATRTPFNDARVEALNAEMKVTMDAPEIVAARIVRAIEQRRAECYIGWPEKVLARLNALLPRLVDQGLRTRIPVIRRHTESLQQN